LAVVLSGAVLVWLIFVSRVLPLWWLLFPILAFIALIVHHERIIRARDFARRAVTYYQRALDRLADNWAGKGERGERFFDPHHPYAGDLDIFGEGSLFELISTARTPAGEETLAKWLLKPSPPDEVRERQAAVTELRPLLDLREDMAMLGEAVRTGVHSRHLIEWAEAPPLLNFRKLKPRAWVLSGLMAVSVVVWAVTGSMGLFMAVLAAVAAFGGSLRPRVLQSLSVLDTAIHDLTLLSGVLSRWERESYQSSLLRRLRQQLDTEGLAASVQIARLNRIVELIDSRDNVLLRVIGPPLLYTTHLCLAVERWRTLNGPNVRRWLEAAGELEALSALAGYSYEHPRDPFPELIDAGGPSMEAQGIGHPLLPESKMVRNDFRLTPDQRLFIISGSNMSGKSTFLRSLGVNTVLALAGAPVRAERLVLTTFSVGATIRIHDSLREGSSRFYAEITRLRKIMDMTGGPLPVLFLLDEMLHGTNSHDRRIGAEGVVRGLVGRGAAGLITTHDLSLTSIAEPLSGLNLHFEDHLEGDRMIFDYKIRPGIVRKSNALALMRMVGLQVDEPKPSSSSET
jgi:hypothetical protein